MSLVIGVLLLALSVVLLMAMLLLARNPGTQAWFTKSIVHQIGIFVFIACLAFGIAYLGRFFANLGTGTVGAFEGGPVAAIVVITVGLYALVRPGKRFEAYARSAAESAPQETPAAAATIGPNPPGPKPTAGGGRQPPRTA